MIYNNLNENSFKPYKLRLKKIEDQIENQCGQKGFYIEKERYYKESLAININPINREKFGGNICLQYIDQKGLAKFRLGLIKTCDVDNFRHYHKETIVLKKELLFFEENIEKLLQNSIDLFERISFEELELKVELPS
ncbi:MAG: hypothetical protein JXR03_20820 [Cyclobacteriaceae bacterium]